MLQRAWVESHLEDFDLLHVHFGFDAVSVSELEDVTDVVHRAGKPIVYTAHDLRNPHHESPTTHDEQLAVLMGTADAVITLTPGAAAAIRDRWQRRAIVLPHPHVVSLDRLSRPPTRRAPDDTFTVGVHAKSLRASMDPLAAASVLVETVAALPDSQLQVNVHADVMTAGSSHHDSKLADFLRTAWHAGKLKLVVHDFMSDHDQFLDYLCDLSVSVLPYRFGTHSGWLEACYDVGTLVVAPDCGFYAEQRPCFSFHQNESGLDATSLHSAVQRAYELRPGWRAGYEERVEERRIVADAHADLYERLCA